MVQHCAYCGDEVIAPPDLRDDPLPFVCTGCNRRLKFKELVIDNFALGTVKP